MRRKGVLEVQQCFLVYFKDFEYIFGHFWNGYKVYLLKFCLILLYYLRNILFNNNILPSLQFQSLLCILSRIAQINKSLVVKGVGLVLKILWLYLNPITIID